MGEAKKFVVALIIGIVIFAVGTFFDKRARQNDENLKVLISTDFHQVTTFRVTTFRIYPKVEESVRASIEFSVPEPIIDEFFQSLRDIQAYLPNHDTVKLPEHTWFLEVSAKGIGKVIHIHFYIPSRQGNIVVGQVVDGSTHFQSQQLFQWYQKYKDRWLKPPTENNEE
jgi:hypothetical protein